MAYYKHPTIDGDGSMSVMLPSGCVQELPILAGVVEWPDGVPIHNRFLPAPEPAGMQELRHQEKMRQFQVLAAELGVPMNDSFAQEVSSEAEDAPVSEAEDASVSAIEAKTRPRVSGRK